MPGPIKEAVKRLYPAGPFGKFPLFAVSLGAGVKMNGALVIPARVETGGSAGDSRYMLLVKIQLTAPGRCRHLGYLRNFLAEGDCSAGVVSIVIPGYAERWDSIHWADRLSGLIIVRVVYIVESFLDLVETPAAAGISFESGN